MVWFDAFSYATFYRAYRTERLYKEIYSIFDYKHNMSTDKRDYFDKQFAIHSYQYVDYSAYSWQHFIDDG